LDKVAEGTFRHDLFFRLSTFRVDIPPLRNRREDIALLAEHFMTLLAEKNRQPRTSLSADALHELQNRSWWGNVRELRNALEHALVLARGGAIGKEHLPAPVLPAGHAPTDTNEAIDGLLRAWADGQLNEQNPSDLIHERLLALVEPPVLAAALERSHGQVATAARRLGLHRITLRKKLDQYGISAK
jgi:two-component system nitrogen regulation response regulator GlnG